MSAVITVNRADLRWALDSVLPHVGSKPRELDWVGFQNVDRGLALFATDGYTVGKAVIPYSNLTMDVIPHCYLTPSEARDLLRFIRPTLKATEQHSVELLVADGELHTAVVPPPEENLETLSEVYALRVPGASFQSVYELIQRTIPKTDYDSATEQIYEPDTFARFAKAGRNYGDRLRVYPKRGTKYGAAYITVGTQFEGAIAGLTYDSPEQEEA